jgi:hypothetical protein
MPRSAQPWQRLTALAVALEAAELREPYPRLAKLMQSLGGQQASLRMATYRMASYS